MKEDITKILFKDQETGISISVLKNYDNYDKCYDVNIKTWQEIEADEIGISLEEFKLMKKEESLNDKIFYEKKNYLEKLEKQKINNDLLLSKKGVYLKELYEEQYRYIPRLELTKTSMDKLVKMTKNKKIKYFYSKLGYYGTSYNIVDYIQDRINYSLGISYNLRHKNAKAFYRELNQFFKYNNKDEYYWRVELR